MLKPKEIAMKILDILLKKTLILGCVAALWGCSSSDGPDEPEVPSRDMAQRNVLVYMVADNSLGNMKCDLSDLEEMRTGVEAGALGSSGNLLIYHNQVGTEMGKAPVLYRMLPGGINDTLKVYPSDTDIYSVDEARMKQVLNDVERLAPAQSTGLVLWSHGSGWQETNSSRSSLVYDPERPMLTSFGEDRGKTMKITTLAQALKGRNLDFIYFDCCFMMSAEVAYELRDCAKYMAGSVTELPVPGTCYDLNLAEFFRLPEPDIMAAARNTFNYYNAQEGQNQTCTMSVVDLSMMEALAQATRQVMEKNFINFDIQQGEVQKFMRNDRASTLFDMEQYMEKLCEKDPTSLEQWRQVFNQTVIYAAATPYIFNQLRINRHCGLGTYIVPTRDNYNYRGYDNQAWWKDVVSHAPAFK